VISLFFLHRRFNRVAAPDPEHLKWDPVWVGSIVEHKILRDALSVY
jgi:hypothetical protein